jgi:hypothetical protein
MKGRKFRVAAAAGAPHHAAILIIRAVTDVY